MHTRHGNVLQAIREKKQLDDALKTDLNAELKEFGEHFVAMKGSLAKA